MGNPADGPLLPAASERHVHAVGRVPRVVATDRGFGSTANEAFLADRRVQRINLPDRGHLTGSRLQHKRQRWFRRQQRWRAGQEASINLCSRKY